MVERDHYRGAIGAFNMHTQVECTFVDEVTPSLTNMREIAPPKSDIPMIAIVQSIAVEYAKEYIIVEAMDSSIRYIVSSLGRWRWQS
jgi:hypothetical protein